MAAGGFHHYPAPIAEIALIKYDDFALWHVDNAGDAVAVTPVAPRGSGDGRTNVAFAERGSNTERKRQTAAANGEALFLPEDDQFSASAFKTQYEKLATGTVAPDDPLVEAPF